MWKEDTAPLSRKVGKTLLEKVLSERGLQLFSHEARLKNSVLVCQLGQLKWKRGNDRDNMADRIRLSGNPDYDHKYQRVCVSILVLEDAIAD